MTDIVRQLVVSTEVIVETTVQPMAVPHRTVAVAHSTEGFAARLLIMALVTTRTLTTVIPTAPTMVQAAARTTTVDHLIGPAPMKVHFLRRITRRAKR